MKIIRIIDGFITNSSTQTTTVLLAVKKGKDLFRLFENLGFPREYPLDFFEFEANQSKVYNFLKEHYVNLAYLRKEYDLYYNIIEDHGPECDKMNDVLYRFNLVIKMVKEIENEAGEDIKVLDCRDALHDGFHIKQVDIYSKEEIAEAFKSEDTDVMKSLIKNEIVNNLEFTKEELAELTQNLKVPLTDIIEKPDDNWDNEWHFEPLYYQVFGIEYVKAFLELLGPDFHGYEYHAPLAMNLSNLELEMLKRKVKGTVQNIKLDEDEHGRDLCRIITMLYFYFGSKELIQFLNDTPYFNVLYKIPQQNYFEKHAFNTVVTAVIDALKSGDKHHQEIAKEIHYKLLDVMKSLILSENRFDRGVQILLYHMIELIYRKKNQLSLIIPTLASIPKDILKDLLESLHFKHTKGHIEDELKKFRQSKIIK